MNTDISEKKAPEIEVPEAILKLEHLRVRQIAFHSLASALRARLRELIDCRKEAVRWRETLATDHSYVAGNSQPNFSARGAKFSATFSEDMSNKRDKRIIESDRQVAAIDALIVIVNAAIDEHQKNSGDAQVFQQAEAHLKGVLQSWGLD